MFETMRKGFNFQKRCVLRVVWSVLLMILGVVSILIGGYVPIPTANAEFSSGFYVGVGSGLVFAGIVLLIRNLRYLHREEVGKQREIWENDERNRMIGLKTWAWSGYAMFLLLYLGVIISGFYSLLVMQVLVIVLLVFLLCMALFGMILRKIM